MNRHFEKNRRKKAIFSKIASITRRRRMAAPGAEPLSGSGLARGN